MPTQGQIRESDLRVKINGLAGQGDPTRMEPVCHGSIERWRVGSGREIFKSHGSGRVKRLSNLAGRVGSGQVNIHQNFRGSGRVGWFGLTRKKPWKIPRLRIVGQFFSRMNEFIGTAAFSEAISIIDSYEYVRRRYSKSRAVRLYY